MSEPCLSCGRDTAPGTRLYASRKRGRDTVAKVDGHLCLACQAGSARVTPDQSVPVAGRYVVMDIGSMTPG